MSSFTLKGDTAPILGPIALQLSLSPSAVKGVTFASERVSTGEVLTRPIAVRFHVRSRQWLSPAEHLSLKSRARSCVVLPIAIHHRLDDVVNVNGLPSGVGPKADVGPVGSSERAHAVCSLPKQWTHFFGFPEREVGDVKAVPERLDDERADSEGADAVLYYPARRSVYATTD